MPLSPMVRPFLELGCGWGSLSLWMARQFPHAKVTAVSSSQAQRAHIEEEARLRGLLNLRVVCADINVFAPDGQFDRIVSVEMFEHVMNWRKLMTRLRSWLAPEGRFFMHIVAHRSGSHLFDRADRDDWIAQRVSTGGLMPSHHLVRQFDDIFTVEKEWCWSGTHYQRTANDWLANFGRASLFHRSGLAQHPWRGDRPANATLALVLSRDLGPVRLCRRNRVGRQPLPHEGGGVIAVF
ncbi:cyclopropane fatty-acyl-phospholipid synthase-like methyltransferase [Bradyrhizobium sp. GM7.3]